LAKVVVSNCIKIDKPLGKHGQTPKESMGPISILWAPSGFSFGQFGPRNGAKLQRKKYRQQPSSSPKEKRWKPFITMKMLCKEGKGC
jgi:hypothetical protein